jgi:PLP dependent protein
MSNLTTNTQNILTSVKHYPNVQVICASKYVTALEMKEIYHAGIRHFGENHAQVLLEKKSLLSDLDIVWHFIGHLQTNKVKRLIDEIDYLHSLDSIKLAKEIQKYRTKPLPCFIELNIANEASKTGLKREDLDDFLKELTNYDKIKIVGLMGMGVDQDIEATTHVFHTLKALKIQYNLPYVSMGMTNDYELALSIGTDFVRVGRKFIL